MNNKTLQESNKDKISLLLLLALFLSIFISFRPMINLNEDNTSSKINRSINNTSAVNNYNQKHSLVTLVGSSSISPTSREPVKQASTSSTQSLSTTNYQYTMSVNSSNIGWYDAVAQGTLLSLTGNDVSIKEGLMFPFPFYNSYFTSVYLSSNGYLSFSDTNPINSNNPSFPNSSNPYVIAPFWYNLQAANNIYVWNTTSFLVIEFSNYLYSSGVTAGTFEVVLFANGLILFQYQNMQTDSGATVGINFGLSTQYYNAYTSDLSSANNFQILFLPAGVNFNLITNFEGGLIGWSWNGLWHLDSTSQIYGKAYSPSHSFWYGNSSTGTYDTPNQANSGWLNSSFVQLKQGSQFLGFESWFSTESGTTFDKKQVYIEFQNGTLNLGLILNSAQQTWQNQLIDLTPYQNQTVRFDFFFNTVDSIANTYPGWYVDDIGLFNSLSQSNIGPIITNSGNLSYTYGITGNIITWTVLGNYPSNYTIYNNTIILSEGNWTSGNPITFNVDNLDVGTYQFTLEVNSSLGYVKSNTILVHVNTPIYAKSPTGTSSSSATVPFSSTTSQTESSGTSSSNPSSPGFELILVILGLNLLYVFKKRKN